MGSASPGIPQPLTASSCGGVSSFPPNAGMGPASVLFGLSSWGAGDTVSPGWSPGVRMWAQGARPHPTPQKKSSWGPPSPREKVSMPAATPSPQLEPPTAGTLKPSRGPVLCWERVSGNPRGAVFAPIRQFRVSPGLSLPHPRACWGPPLLGGPGCASGSCDRRRRRREQVPANPSSGRG